MSNNLILHTLCAKYNIFLEAGDALISELGSAINTALNDGFDKGKHSSAPLVEITNLLSHYGIQTPLDAELSAKVNGALYNAFKEGFRQGACIARFKKNAGNDEDMLATASIMDQMAKPENLILLNYLTE